MIDRQQIRHLRPGTRDLGAEDGARRHHGDERGHTLDSFEGDPRDQTVGFELRT